MIIIVLILLAAFVNPKCAFYIYIIYIYIWQQPFFSPIKNKYSENCFFFQR